MGRSYFTSCTSLKYGTKNVFPCYSLDAWLVTSRTGRRNGEIQCSSGLFWQLIAKNRKRRLALHTALSTGYQRRQLLLQVACLTVLLLANNNGAAVLSRSCICVWNETMCNARASPKQMSEEPCKRIEHCCATLRRSRNRRNVGSCSLKRLTCFKLRATTPSNT